MRDGSMQTCIDGVNALQSVQWATSPISLEAALEFIDADDLVRKPREPKYLFEARKRQRKRTVLSAAEFNLANFYTPMSLDWRGRVYADPHHHFGREDLVRSQFRFARADPITPDAINWLKIHVANVGDFRLDDGRRVSKLSFADRIRWVDRNLDAPWKTGFHAPRDWKKAAKPLQYLTACKELDAVLSIPGFTTRLPCSFDATASGIQHMCAATRSEEGAKVNLVPSAEPQDIYGAVAGRVETRLRASDGPHVETCLAWGIDRDLAKLPVMTFGYSVTQWGIANQLKGELAKRKIRWDHRSVWYLAEVIYDSIEDEIRGPADVKRFLREVVTALNKIGKPLSWRIPVGLLLLNDYRKPKYKRIELSLRGARFYRKIAVGYTPEINPKEALNGVVPNVIHALDASLMLMTAAACAAEDIELATVHDCFGCLATNARRMNEIVREQFVKLYSEHDVLAEIRDSAERDGAKNLPDLPQRGRLDLNAVLKSEYFLS
jgi:Autographiviridae RNA polymerase